MDKIERQNWLESLKEGNQVCANLRKGYVIYTIKKITATGKIRLNNNILLDEDGYKALDKFNRNIINIEPITENILKQIKEKEALRG